jgi:diacylglycerol kinase (ATP)
MQSKLGELTTDLNSDSSLQRQHRIRAWKVANNIFVSFKYAWSGVTYSFYTQRNFRIHCCMGALALSLGIALRLPGVEMAALSITSGLVLTLELLNTAIESVVDLTVEQNYHELAKIAKDCAAGAVLISALASLLVAGWLILPRLVIAIAQAIT